MNLGKALVLYALSGSGQHLRRDVDAGYAYILWIKRQRQAGAYSYLENMIAGPAPERLDNQLTPGM